MTQENRIAVNCYAYVLYDYVKDKTKITKRNDKQTTILWLLRANESKPDGLVFNSEPVVSRSV